MKLTAREMWDQLSKLHLYDLTMKYIQLSQTKKEMEECLSLSKKHNITINLTDNNRNVFELFDACYMILQHRIASMLPKYILVMGEVKITYCCDKSISWTVGTGWKTISGEYNLIAEEMEIRDKLENLNSYDSTSFPSTGIFYHLLDIAKRNIE